MRWIWIDRIVELVKARRCVAIKNVSLAEDVVHDQFRATDRYGAQPVLANPLIIEGMAQTAGILVGHARDFAEKVILAKIGRAEFVAAARPGYSLRFTAEIERIDGSGASTTGQVELIEPHTGEARPLASINLLFAHANADRTGLELPERNFVFEGQVMELLRDVAVRQP